MGSMLELSQLHKIGATLLLLLPVPTTDPPNISAESEKWHGQNMLCCPFSQDVATKPQKVYGNAALLPILVPPSAFEKEYIILRLSNCSGYSYNRKYC